MSEKRKAKLILLIALVIVLVITGICIWEIHEENKLTNRVKDIMKNSNPEIIYIGRPTCYYCNLLEPITDSLKKEYNLKYNYINVDEISNNQLKRILKLFGRDLDTFGTPYIVIARNGKVIDEQSGFADEDVIFDFFKRNELIDKNESLLINYLTEEEVNNIVKDNLDSVLLLGEVGNEKVTLAKDKVKELIKENDIEISYFDLTKITDEDKQTEILSNLGYKEEIELPLFLLIKSGKIEAFTTDVDDYEDILRSNDYIK